MVVTQAIWHKGLMITLILLVIAIIFSLFIKPKDLPNDSQRTTFRQAFANARAGKISLGQCYWTVNIFGKLCTVFLISLIAHIISPLAPASTPLVLFTLIFGGYYCGFCTIATWRCARNSNRWKGWGILARTSTILDCILLVAIVVVLMLSAANMN